MKKRFFLYFACFFAHHCFLQWYGYNFEIGIEKSNSPAGGILFEWLINVEEAEFTAVDNKMEPVLFYGNLIGNSEK